MRLGGEFRRGPDETDPISLERFIYLQAVVRIQPAVLQTLEESVYPVYAENRPFTDADLASENHRRPLQVWREARDRFLRDGRVAALVAALARWQARWNLPEPWVAEQAVLAFWRWDPEVRSDRYWGSTLAHCWCPSWAGDDALLNVPALPSDPLFRFPSWYPLLLTRREYEAMARAKFEKVLAEYASAVEQRAADEGLHRTAEVRARSAESPLLHFEWLARWRVPDAATGKPWSKKKIAKEYGVKWTTVKEALDKTAKLLD